MKFNWTIKKVLAATTGVYALSLFILYCDQATPDLTLMITLLVALFGFQLNNERRLTRVEDNISDIKKHFKD
jgi:hypothetical protein